MFIVKQKNQNQFFTNVLIFFTTRDISEIVVKRPNCNFLHCIRNRLTTSYLTSIRVARFWTSVGLKSCNFKFKKITIVTLHWTKEMFSFNCDFFYKKKSVLLECIGLIYPHNLSQNIFARSQYAHQSIKTGIFHTIYFTQAYILL